MDFSTLQSDIKPTDISNSALDNLATIYYGQSDIINNSQITKPAMSGSCGFFACTNNGYRDSLKEMYPYPEYYYENSNTEKRTALYYLTIGVCGWIYNDPAMHGRDDLPFLYQDVRKDKSDNNVADLMCYFTSDGQLCYKMYPNLNDKVYNYRTGVASNTPPENEWIFFTFAGTANGGIHFGWKHSTGNGYNDDSIDIRFEFGYCPIIRRDYQTTNLIFSADVTYSDPYKYYDLSTKPDGLVDNSNNTYYGKSFSPCPDSVEVEDVSGIPVESLR